MFEYWVTYEDVIGRTSSDVIYADNEADFFSVPTNVELLGTV